MSMKHPHGLYVLFFAELWERFSFYGMRALLVLYLTKELSFSDDHAYGIYGAYGALVYTTPVIGGLLADRVLGHQQAIIMGALLMALGHFCLAVPNMFFFYAALALLIAGSGLFKPNISSLVGQLYAIDDPRRDAGFTLFYMGINIGGFLAPLLCGFIGQTYGWHYGFGLAGVGMLIGLAVFLLGRRRFANYGLPPPAPAARNPVLRILTRRSIVWAGVLLSLPVFGLLVLNDRLTGWVLIAAGAAVLAWLVYIVYSSPRVARERLLVIMTLTAFGVVFWSFFEQGGSSINLFTDRNIDRSLFGWEAPASLFQAINPMFIILLAPVFSALWLKLARHGREPSTPVKFAYGILQLAAGFALFGLGAGLAGADGKTSMLWLLIGYLLITSGELSLSPVGLAMVTRLAPARLVGAMMGVWFLSSAFAHYIAALIATLTSAPVTDATAALPPARTIDLYGEVFLNIAIAAAVVGAVLLLMSPLLKRWMHSTSGGSGHTSSARAPGLVVHCPRRMDRHGEN
ncbi:MAG: peptide MFS transporter [Gammaproteobacteria bacterium]|nr:peptide MFS transporter [Gammaproteobacteria bacterium]